MTHRLKVFFDGGCRPNPGPIEVAVVVRGEAHYFDDLGSGSNTDAEWRALFCAIGLARELGLRDVEFIGDSLEVTRRASSILSSGQALPGQGAAFLALVADCSPARVRWIKRHQNLAGIALAARRLP